MSNGLWVTGRLRKPSDTVDPPRTFTDEATARAYAEEQAARHPGEDIYVCQSVAVYKVIQTPELQVINYTRSC